MIQLLAWLLHNLNIDHCFRLYNGSDGPNGTIMFQRTSIVAVLTLPSDQGSYNEELCHIYFYFIFDLFFGG